MSYNLKEVGFLNLPYIDEAYEQWTKDKESVDPSWRAIFESTDEGGGSIDNVAQMYRTLGHLNAKISPIHERERVPLPASKEWERIYCGPIGFEYKGIVSLDVEEFLQKRIEEIHSFDKLERKRILNHLNRSELFETFLHTKYPGQKRFSLEGAETLMPMLSWIIDQGAEMGVKEFWIGMSHRGRLNVLSNILGKSYSEIFMEFEDGYISENSGDVKYHKGFYSEIQSADGKSVEVIVASNPSHLESVCPVIEGKVRARQEKMEGNAQEAIPILIHGDAAISGQGVVYETLQLSKLPGYSVGGTIHIVINNEIGFTTLPEEGRSTTYCTDIAKAFGAPVFHVNAEYPESACFCAQLAIELRQKFGIDVFIDLLCYRKYGHNESDEPFFTQPIEYSEIKKKQSIRELYRDQLIGLEAIDNDEAMAIEGEFKKALDEALSKKDEGLIATVKKKEPVANLFVNTKVPKEQLIEIAAKLNQFPKEFHPHKKIEQLYSQREKLVTIDWGMGETLAYATLLKEGRHVRITGQDVGRGTFSHRQALLVDQENGKKYYPLDQFGNFSIYNSPLSEFAALGFEFGYSAQYLEALTIWEAQFGDFANGAQVIIDQYLSTSEEKWGQRNSLTLFLPHGYEGQGPEHSSARLERFLALCGKNNMQIVNPTLPSQLFHLLRRQVLGEIRRPLVVFTPKALLRHPLCQSSLEDLANGHFYPVIEDEVKGATRAIVCSGKIYYDLLKAKTADTVIIRIEELYPFPKEELSNILSKYSLKELLFAQEEPRNMGPCWYIEQEWKNMAPNLPKLQTVARETSASPAVGSHEKHNQELQTLLRECYGNRD